MQFTSWVGILGLCTNHHMTKPTQDKIFLWHATVSMLQIIVTDIILFLGRTYYLSTHSGYIIFVGYNLKVSFRSHICNC